MKSSFYDIIALDFLRAIFNSIIVGEITMSRTGTSARVKLSTVDFSKATFNGIIVGKVKMSSTGT